MKLLVLSRFGRLGASSRVRIYQYLPYLEQAGVECIVSPLLSDDYLNRLYSGNPTHLLSRMVAYLRRVHTLIKSGQYDLLWIEYELFPWFPGFFELLLSKLSIPYVVDYDDAVFHRYDQNCSRLVRLCLGKKIAKIMKMAKTVIVGNSYLANYANQTGASKVVTLPTVVDMSEYGNSIAVDSTPFTVGWIGTPVTFPYLSAILPVLSGFCSTHNARIVAIGAGENNSISNEKRMLVKSWSESSEVSDISSFHVGVMPIPDTPWARGKCGYKLIQYMACGIPVIASPVGMNRELVTNYENGFLADNKSEWLAAVEYLRKNKKEREQMGRTGRKLVEKEYSLLFTAPKLLDTLLIAAGEKM